MASRFAFKAPINEPSALAVVVVAAAAYNTILIARHYWKSENVNKTLSYLHDIYNGEISTLYLINTQNVDLQTH